MNLSALSGLLKAEPQFQRLSKSLKSTHAKEQVQVLGNAVPFTLATLWQGLGVSTLVVTPRPEDARRLHEQLLVWTGGDASVLHFPESETLPFERLVSDADTVQQRLHTLSALIKPKGDVSIVVASAVAVSQKTLGRRSFTSNSQTLRLGLRVDLDTLLGQWQRMGYRFEPAVYGPGLASRRGGILDIHPIGSSHPARIELWGSEIESIRLFDPDTQRSVETVDSIDIMPAQETLPALTDREYVDRLVASLDMSTCTDSARERVQEELSLLLDGHEVDDLNFYSGFFHQGSLLDYLPEDSLLVMDRPSETAEAVLDTEQRTQMLRTVKEQRGELPLHFPSSHLPWSEVEEGSALIRRRLDVTPWGAVDLVHRHVHVLPFTSAPTFFGKRERFVLEAGQLAEEDHRVVAITSHSKRLGEILSDHGIGADLLSSLDETPGPGSITVLQSQGAGIDEGFVLSVDGSQLVIFSDTEIFGVTKQRRSTRRSTFRRDAFLSELSPGDYVVHVEHGIGRFVGTGRMAGDSDGTEYLILQYAQRDKLYVPLEHLDRVTPYVAPMEHPPSLARLGTGDWQRTKDRVARSTREMAAELLSLYAGRQLVEGRAFSPDTQWQAELEESFPYEETPDQSAAILEVKADMESSKPMDRLVCGDVGYGKTEVALRAAFKAVMDGKQVAVLVPTTVLAQQHYVTFSQRLSAYPTKVDVLSRFRTDREQREIIEGLASGRIDICIGTHRLVQNDVRFKDLGLVIIDEEQRFGVAHKERLKQVRKEVDVLTLTATPIPRTLHMSLAGVRDMSTMETPPEERLPIKTYVSEFSDELIREAILRELDRQGQVYFLHNRVHSIDYMATYVSTLVPEAKVAVAHGQMPENQLEQAMVDFAQRKMDVLLCTTIIESGLDIPNVNTLIINRADTFGLAQLYQLRGRVGRSARRAYSYLLVPKARSLTEAGERRLNSMLAATELGAGFRIAMKDLEIRGAGNILGSQQSGHIHAVGFDLYTRLLSIAVEDLRAQGSIDGIMKPIQEADADTLFSPALSHGWDSLSALGDRLVPVAATTVDVGIPASIPEEYISDLPTRLGIYHRLVKLTEVGEIEDVADELHDRFGPLPWQAQNLLYVVRLRLRGQKAGIESITRESDLIVFRLKDQVGDARRALQRVLGTGFEIGNTRLRLRLDQLADGWEGPLEDSVEKLVDFRERLEGQIQMAQA